MKHIYDMIVIGGGPGRISRNALYADSCRIGYAGTGKAFGGRTDGAELLRLTTIPDLKMA